MIVDMMRNDLGRIAEVGSVAVPELFTVERYPTVWQMTSLVTAETDASLEQIFAALHPSASVTGAPKVRTMEILADLEPEPRGVYTGAIGYVAPGRRRPVQRRDSDGRGRPAPAAAVVRRRQRHRLGFERGRRVRRVPAEGRGARPAPPAFELLETMRWSPAEGFFLLDRHLRRLGESAEYFGFPSDERAVADALGRIRRQEPTGPLRVRLLPVVERRVRPWSAPPLQVRRGAGARDARRVAGRSATTCSCSTRRRIARSTTRLALADADDVILWNERRRGDRGDHRQPRRRARRRRVTPPVECGLLAGTFRGGAARRGERSASGLSASTTCGVRPGSG